MTLTAHGFCLRWLWHFLLPIVGGDVSMFVAYAVIGGLLAYVATRPAVRIVRLLRALGLSMHSTAVVLGGILRYAWLFGLFIACCGVTHLLSALSIWYSAVYPWLAFSKALAGIISIVTAAVLLRDYLRLLRAANRE